MPSKNPKVHPITITNPLIDTYCFNHSTPLPQALYEIERYTQKNILAHRMLSNHIQAHFLIAISKMLNPRNILEIGTFTGYSSICLAQGIKKNGQIITIEKNARFIPIAQHFFEKYQYNNIKIIHSDALQYIPKIKQKFDIIYLDADKQNYNKYIEVLISKLSSKGWLIIDNTLWKGLVIESPKEPVTKKMQEFNQTLQQYKNLFCTILPIRDGITLIKKIKN